MLKWNVLILALFAISARAEIAVEEAAGLIPPDDQRIVHVMDIDDNILIMPTQIFLFPRSGGVELGVSSERYAAIRLRLGADGGPGHWSRYQLNLDRRTGSFRDFFDEGDPNVFIRHLTVALDRQSFGRSWPAWVRALAHPVTARDLHALSARGHLPQTGLAGAVLMQRRGLTAELPRLENFHFVGAEPDIPAAKARKLFEILDELQSSGVTPRMWEIVSRDGVAGGRKAYHLWGFSDDDINNINAAVSAIGAEVLAQPERWSHVKHFFYYTGPTREGMERGAYVMTNRGELRRPVPEELYESRRILAAKSCPAKVKN